MAMASCSLHVNPFLTWTSGGNPESTSLAFDFVSGSQLEYLFHRFRLFGKSAYAHEIGCITELEREGAITIRARTSTRTNESASTALKN